MASGVALAAAASAQAPADVRDGVAAYGAGRVDEARRIFERLSRDGSPVADYNLGVMHLRGDLPGGVARALPLLRRAADAGFVTAMFDLGRLHEDGTATDRPDLAGAHRWYLRAAEAGSVEAQVEAATAFYLGRGAPRDPMQAAHWYREAAKGGDVGAQYLIASMYEDGLGVERDLRLARYWYDVARRNGDVAAEGKVRELDARAAAGG
jgi:TPR repeat protein